MNKSAPRLIWGDEFNYTGEPDTTKWNYDLGGHGWGNNELQYYTNNSKNVRVENGNLVIEARKDSLENRAYTSTRIVSKKKGDWLYGKIEVRAKLPKGKGTWPAIWMLSTDWKYGALAREWRNRHHGTCWVRSRGSTRNRAHRSVQSH
jgi:beta-glucanase (GH16 family)